MWGDILILTLTQGQLRTPEAQRLMPQDVSGLHSVPQHLACGVRPKQQALK